MPEEVLAFKIELFPDLPEGLVFDLSFLPPLLAAAEFVPRDQAEANPGFKQLITYSILRYGDTVFRYKRSAWGSERRLHGMYSIGVGGHVNRSDVLPLWTNATSIVEWARDRELQEEFYVECPGQPGLIGLLNEEGNEVARFHLGIVYEYWLDSPKVDPREKRVHLRGGFVPITDLAAHQANYESWSRIIITQYLSRS
jgi:predicted NUDIX family phosphoesterase